MASKNEKIDGIAAVIGDSIILNSELEAYIFLKINRLGLKPDSLEANILQHKLLDELIDGKVLLVYAEKDTNIFVSNEEIDNELGVRLDYIMKQNQLTIRDLDSILFKEQGIHLNKFKNELRIQIRQELLKQKVQQFYVSSSKVNKSEVETFYNEYKDSLPSLGKSIHLSKISINVTPSDETKQKAYSKITSIKEMLDNGDDFTELAKLHSDGPNASNGGLLGYISKGTLSELKFEKIIFSLKPGETSNPFATRLGFHIVNVIERKDQEAKVRQIFINTSPSNEIIKTTISLLDSIKDNCTSKKVFKEAILKYSNDEVSKAQNGLLKWQTIASLDPKIKENYDTLGIGNITKPIKDDNIISLYRVEDLKDNRKLSLTEDWNEVAQIAQRIYTQKKLIELVNKWRKETFIDIRL